MTMNRAKLQIALLIACFVPAVCFAEPQHISADKFCELYRLPMGTMKFSKYVGIDDGRAVIELHEMSSFGTRKWDKETYWTEASSVEKKCIDSG